MSIVGMSIVETTAGKLRGEFRDGIHSFKGIHYAASPGGDGRFRPPRPIVPWTHVRDALAYSALAMQDAFVPPPGELAFYGRILAEGMDEDCLALNVWTPSTSASTAKRPVMVWVHGGWFSMGAGATVWTDGTRLARDHDVVVISLNHRLNAFGHLYLGGMSDEYAESGNVGLLDIVAALGWVRDNIDRFGGDPDNVTLFGESGGGMKISALLAMPAAQGLFHRAIIQSGSRLQATPRETADDIARRLLARLDISPRHVSLLAQVPPLTIRSAAGGLLDTAVQGFIEADDTMSFALDFAPVIDGCTLLRHPFDPDAPASAADVPLLVGTNRDEVTRADLLPAPGEPLVSRVRRFGVSAARAQGLVDARRLANPLHTEDQLLCGIVTDFAFRKPALLLAERKAAQRSAPAFVYLFGWEWPGNGMAGHAIEIPFVFGNLTPEVIGPLDEAGPRALADQISAVWAAFARSGDPNVPGLPEWRPYDPAGRTTMRLGYPRES